MEVKILEEAGYNSALYGFSLSYKDRAVKRKDWWKFWDEPLYLDTCKDIASRMVQTAKTATANAGRGLGHDKWLRQVQLWIDLEMPRYWWSEFDTYKVGTVAQSESTMHTLSRRKLTCADFDNKVDSAYVSFLNSNKADYDIQQLKGSLPESYLQRRVVSLNYAVLRCIIEQRKGHRLPEWAYFIDEIYKQASHPELLPKRG